MNDVKTLRQESELKYVAAKWFSENWGIPEEAYLECIESYISGETEYGWYIILEDGQIASGLGVIENDFHNREDLFPNICAVYTEEIFRGRGYAGKLLEYAVDDLRSKNISPVYLVTDHTGFYERYGFEFYCMVNGEDGEGRLYIHR